MNQIRVLVTGAGSGVGQGIIKALRISSLPIYIISADISSLNSALFRSDNAILIPKVESEGALDVIITKLKKVDIDVVMIGSEFDLHFFSKYKKIIQQETGTLIITSPLETVELAEDKWLTTNFLKERNLPYAEAYIPTKIEDCLDIAKDWGYPLAFKTRTGTSSRHFHIVTNQGQLEYVFDSVPNPMLQQMIVGSDGNWSHEYTCSIFKCKDETILGPFTSKRTLRGGNSWVIEVKQSKELHPLLISIGEALAVIGSFNVQLMFGPKGPIPFEFNARFSGTTAVRAHFGFNEPELAIRSYLLGEQLENPDINTGLAFRYLEEVFVEKATIDQAEKYFTQGIVRSWF